MTNRLHKSRTSRVLAGVCGGLGEYFAIDPTIVRLLFVLLAIFNGVGILAYIVLWIVMPEESAADIHPRDAMRQNINRIRDDVEQFGGQFRGSTSRPETGQPSGEAEAASAEGATQTAFESPEGAEAVADTETTRAVETYRISDPVPPMDSSTAANRQMLAGAALLIIGALMLLSNLNIFWWFSWGRMWPLVLVGIGAWLLYDRSKSRAR